MGATERKRYQRIHKNRLQAHGVRRKRKAKRTAMAAAGASHGTRGKQNVFIRCRTYSRIQSLPQTKKEVAMNKSKIIETLVKVVVAALTAFLTAITTTSCMGCGPF